MPRPMTRYKINKPKPIQHSFVEGRHGHLVYAEYGIIKVYANITQVEKRIIMLKSIGYEVVRSIDHPYIIILDELGTGNQ